MAARKGLIVLSAMLLCFVLAAIAGSERAAKHEKQRSLETSGLLTQITVPKKHRNLMSEDPCDGYLCDETYSCEACDYADQGCSCDRDDDDLKCYTASSPAEPEEDPCDGYLCDESESCDYTEKGCKCDIENDEKCYYPGEPPSLEPKDPCDGYLCDESESCDYTEKGCKCNIENDEKCYHGDFIPSNYDCKSYKCDDFNSCAYLRKQRIYCQCNIHSKMCTKLGSRPWIFADAST